MRIFRIYHAGRLGLGLEVRLAGQAHHYIYNVLRLTQGDSLRLFNDAGEEYLCRISYRDRRIVQLICEQQLEALPESPLPLEIFLSMSKGASMDFAIQKAVELGVTAIRPVITEYTAQRGTLGDRQGKLAHWQGVVRSAAEQCGRIVLPKVYAPSTLEDIQLPSKFARLALVPGTPLSLKRRLKQLATEKTEQGDYTAISLLIGPEGGLSERDLMTLTQLGFEFVNMGVRILRVETAATVAVGLA